jgi:hypothetical protein
MDGDTMNRHLTHKFITLVFLLSIAISSAVVVAFVAFVVLVLFKVLELFAPPLTGLEYAWMVTP